VVSTKIGPNITITPATSPEEAVKRLELITEVWDEFFERTESFEDGEVGMWLAYLLGAIAKGEGFDLWPHPDYDAFRQILREAFPPGHRVWSHITVRRVGE